jgi:hypothetical protein
MIRSNSEASRRQVHHHAESDPDLAEYTHHLGILIDHIFNGFSKIHPMKTCKQCTGSSAISPLQVFELRSDGPHFLLEIPCKITSSALRNPPKVAAQVSS